VIAAEDSLHYRQNTKNTHKTTHSFTHFSSTISLTSFSDFRILGGVHAFGEGATEIGQVVMAAGGSVHYYYYYYYYPFFASLPPTIRTKTQETKKSKHTHSFTQFSFPL